MTDPTVPQRVLFPELGGKPVVATFDRDQASSDDGAVLLTAAERVYGLVQRFARCLVDKRAPERIRHTLADLAGQRVFGIARGHPDGNDADHLAEDPIHKLLLGRGPVTGERLASQPTLSRFENGVGRGALYEMARVLAESVIERHRHRQRRRGAGAADHDRSGLDGRPDARGATATFFQTVIRHVVLSAAAGVRDQVMEVALYHALGDPTGTSIHPTDSAEEAVLEDRHGVCSTIVTSQLPVEKWHDVIGDPPLADAILDRLAHNTVVLEHDEVADQRQQPVRIAEAFEQHPELRQARLGQPSPAIVRQRLNHSQPAVSVPVRASCSPAQGARPVR